MHWLNKDWYK